MTPVVLGLGGNLGDPLAAMQGALDSLRRHPDIDVLRASSVYRTDPVGGPEQPVFLNAVALIETTLNPDALLATTQAIELEWHRTREIHWGPRTLDIDIITFGDVQQDDPHLRIPHPLAHTRAFVLAPWIEIQPDALLPGLGPISAAFDSLDTDGIARTDLALH